MRRETDLWWRSAWTLLHRAWTPRSVLLDVCTRGSLLSNRLRSIAFYAFTHTHTHTSNASSSTELPRDQYTDKLLKISTQLNQSLWRMYSVSPKKSPPPQFSDIFSQTDGNFLINFYTPITRSFLHQTTNFYSIISNFDEFLHFTRSLTSKFAYWANDVTVDVMSYPTCLLTL